VLLDLATGLLLLLCLLLLCLSHTVHGEHHIIKHITTTCAAALLSIAIIGSQGSRLRRWSGSRSRPSCCCCWRHCIAPLGPWLRPGLLARCLYWRAFVARDLSAGRLIISLCDRLACWRLVTRAAAD
jgi:hypothetical protein